MEAAEHAVMADRIVDLESKLAAAEAEKSNMLEELGSFHARSEWVNVKSFEGGIP
jgi:hypothetical protein